MIVCVCKRARETDIAQAIAEGASSVDDVGAACGAGTCCGSCRDHIHQMLDDAGVGCGSTGDACPDCPGRRLPMAS